MNPEFSTDFRKTLKYNISWNPLNESPVVPYEWTDRQGRADITELIVATQNLRKRLRKTKFVTTSMRTSHLIKTSCRICGLISTVSSLLHTAQRHRSNEEIGPYSAERVGLTIHAAVDRTQWQTATTNIIRIKFDHNSPRKQHTGQTPWVFGKRLIIFLSYLETRKKKELFFLAEKYCRVLMW